MRELSRRTVTGGRRPTAAARRAATLTAALLVAFVAGSTTAAAEYHKPGTCREVALPVALAEGAPATETAAATFCTPLHWADGARQVDILVAGGTYTREYWDFSFDPETYSYVDDTLSAGRATFNFDRLGTGASSRPDGRGLTVSNDAFVLHQLITWLHEQGYAHVNAVGHSLGSVTLTNEAARWHDLDRMVLTGIIHLPGVGPNSIGMFANTYPATLDPITAGRGTDDGYMTTLPGRRGSIFYNPATADPAVIDHDERTKDVGSVGETTESMTMLLSPAQVSATRSITARVLVVMGAEDTIFCNLLVSCREASSIAANEAPYYSGAADFDVLVVPDAAHNLALHPNAPQTFQAIDRWMTTGDL